MVEALSMNSFMLSEIAQKLGRFRRFNWNKRTLQDMATYLLENKTTLEHQRFITEQGHIETWRQMFRGRDTIFIYFIELYPSLKRKGLFTAFLKRFLNNPIITEIDILAVGSWEMIWCLKKFDPKYVFHNQGGDFYWQR